MKKKCVNIALFWFALATLGSLPYFSSGMNFCDAFFEATLALTSVGATNIAPDDYMYPYRAFLSVSGGLAFMFSLPFLADISGCFGLSLKEKLPPLKLAGVYFFLFVFSMLLYLLFGADLKDAVIFSCLTVSLTGGAVMPENLLIPASLLMGILTAVPALFMRQISRVSLKKVLKREEFRIFGIILAFSATILVCSGVPLKEALFFALSFFSTAGFYTPGFASLNNFSLYILYIAALTGGAIISLTGGIKLIRIIVLLKLLKKELKRVLHPRMIVAINIDNSPVSHKITGRILAFFFLYTSSLFVLILILSLFEQDFAYAALTAISVFTTAGILPAHLAIALFSLPPMAKIIISIFLIISRLEIFAFLLLIQILYKSFRQI